MSRDKINSALSRLCTDLRSAGDEALIAYWAQDEVRCDFHIRMLENYMETAQAQMDELRELLKKDAA